MKKLTQFVPQHYADCVEIIVNRTRFDTHRTPQK
jgi:hypothetical protein